MAQDGIYNGGDTLYIAPGEVIQVQGTVQNAGSGYLENRGTVRTQGSINNSARIRLVPGEFRMVGFSPQTITMGGDSLHTLVLDMGGSVNVSTTDFVYVQDSLGLINGILATSPSAVVQVGKAQGVSAGNSLSFVNGPMEVWATNDTIYYPIGNGVNFRPLWLNDVLVGSTLPIIRFYPIAGATGGYDSIGMGNLGNARYYQGSVTSGDYNGASNLTLSYGFDDVSSFSFEPRVGNSQVVNAGYYSLGASSSSWPAFVGTVTSQNMPSGSSLGYFVLGECRYVSGDNLVASADTHCIGQQAVIVATGYEPTGDYYWMASSDSLNYIPIAGATSPSLNLMDTLVNKLFFQFVVDGATCRADTSNWARIVTREPNRLQLRAILQGPYHFLGDTMHYGNASGYGGGLNDPTIGEAMLLTDNYQYPMGTGLQDTTMHPGYAVPDSAVDIVRVELWRDTNSDNFPDLKVDSTWGWMTGSGRIINFFNGQNSSPVFFCESASDDYFVIVKHRNHLPVMSNSAVDISPTPSGTLDLTTAASAFTNYFALVELQTGKFGMWAGDVADDPANGDIYFVDAFDFFTIFDANTTPIGNVYDRRDANLDGEINGVDYNYVSRNNDYFVSSPAPY
jgi:hypothetical protein